MNELVYARERGRVLSEKESQGELGSDRKRERKCVCVCIITYLCMSACQHVCMYACMHVCGEKFDEVCELSVCTKLCHSVHPSL